MSSAETSKLEETGELKSDHFQSVREDSQKVLIPAEKKVDDALRTVFSPVLRMVPKSFKGALYRTVITGGFQVVVNSVAAKYKQFLATTTGQIAWSNVGGSTEFSSLDGIFDEFFVHSVTLRFLPRNKYSAQSTATSGASGSPGDLNTCAATVYCLTHGASDYADSATTWTAAVVARHHKFVNLGDSFVFRVRNPEKYDPKGPLGDMTTASSTMSWCQTTASAKYGGFFGLATPAASGAAIGIGTLLEGGIFGDLLAEWDLSFRARA